MSYPFHEAFLIRFCQVLGPHAELTSGMHWGLMHRLTRPCSASHGRRGPTTHQAVFAL